MKIMRGRKKRHLEAEVLEAALVERLGHPRVDGMIQAAARLEPSVPIRETRRTQAKNRMLRAYASAGTAGTNNAGTLDTPEVEVYTAEVALPDGRMLLADVEKISPDRAARFARAVAELDQVKGQ